MKGRWWLIAQAIAIVLLLCVRAQEQAPSVPENNQVSSLIDMCAPVEEAKRILASLQAPPNAHLEGKVGHLAHTKGWGDGLGWGQDGPLSTTLRLLPRLLNLLSPKTWLNQVASLLTRLPLVSRLSRSGGGGGPKSVRVTKSRREKAERVMALLNEAEHNGCREVWKVRGEMRMFPPKGIRQDLPAAYTAYKRYLEKESDSKAQFIVGFFHATGLGGVDMDQGKALAYYTFSALQGYRPATMALGYRHWAGISVKEDCLLALEYYETAAEQSYLEFSSGPPGGRTLPLTSTRLSDQSGGIYGPDASWASTGANIHRPAIHASSALARGETEKEVLEFYQYNSDRDQYRYTALLGRLFYFGSVYAHKGGVASGAEGVGEIPQDFKRARDYFTKVARALWPADFDVEGRPVPRRKLSKELEEELVPHAAVAAGFLGRMALRGEGGPPDYRKARLWFDRASDHGDREAHNGLGIMHRDGLLTAVDKSKAYKYFQAAAGQDLAEAQINMAKLHLERGELTAATQLLQAALQNGSPFEAYHLFANIHAKTARLPLEAGGRPGMCGAAVAWYKLVAERGTWSDDFSLSADRAWARGEEDKALLGWWIAAEMGSESAQNNVAYVLSQGEGLVSTIGFGLRDREGPRDISWVNSMTPEEKRERELAMWVRSAAQDNVDSMVMVGDYYYKGYASANETERHEKAVTYYQTAADTQTSAMAFWNLGWMYENGQGVPRDWHLAKRFYDASYDVNAEAYLPMMISLVQLYLRSWWHDLKSGGKEPGLPLFEPDENLPGVWERIKAIVSPTVVYDDFYAHEGGDAYGEYEHDKLGGADDYSGAGWAGTDGHPGGAERGGPAGIAADLEEDLLESGVILGLGFAVMALVWIRGRWAAQEREREDRARRERDRQARQQQQPQQPPPPAVPVPDPQVPALRVVDGADGHFDGLPVGWEPPLQ